MNTLKAERRDMTIKAKKLRREGFVTGSIFGREMEETIPLKMEKGAVERLLKEEGKGGQVMLELEGRTYDALIKEVDYNPLKGCIDEIDFQALVKYILLQKYTWSTWRSSLPEFRSRCCMRSHSRHCRQHWQIR